ncbi:MAG: hypothetical protein NT099_07865 [Candidatus Saganbacteria bacterium]|nr:hypothetical protein [Candidatus Saganbacteria bacterium]
MARLTGITGPDFRAQLKKGGKPDPAHAADRLFMFGPGTVHTCADTSVAAEVRRIQEQLKMLDPNAKLGKGTTNPTLLKQYIEKRGPQAILQDLFCFENRLDPSAPIDIAAFAVFKRDAAQGSAQAYLHRVKTMVYSQLLNALEGAPLSAEVDYVPGTTTADDIVSQAVDIARIAPEHIVVKVPVAGPAEVEVIRVLENDYGIRVNATLVFTQQQALDVAHADATFISPFAGRVDDHMAGLAKTRGGQEAVTTRVLSTGMDFVQSVVAQLGYQGLSSMVIPASVRGVWKQTGAPTDHLERIYAMSLSASAPLVPTIPTSVILDPKSAEMLWLFHQSTQNRGYSHPLLASGLAGFDKDGTAWQEVALKGLEG